MKGWGVLLAAVVLATVPATAAAKPGGDDVRERAKIEFPGSNGYRFEVQAHSGQKGDLFSLVSVTAENGPASVSYTVEGALANGGSLDLHLPHVGRIAVVFVPKNEKRVRLPGDCKGHPSIVTSGNFRGSIVLHGERGYSTVDRDSAHGRVIRSFRKACDKLGSGSERPAIASEETESPKPGTTLAASLKNGSLLLMAGALGRDPEVPGTSASALKTRFRAGMMITNSVTVEADADSMVAPDPDDSKLVELAPPAPFEGSARFTLTKPKTASWSGNLAVDLPGLGRTRLAGPSFESTLCSESRCTDTASDLVKTFAKLVSALFSLESALGSHVED